MKYTYIIKYDDIETSSKYYDFLYSIFYGILDKSKFGLSMSKHVYNCETATIYITTSTEEYCDLFDSIIPEHGEKYGT